MKILFYYYMGGGGGMSNIVHLLRTIAREHPQDVIEIVSSPSASFGDLENESNIRIRTVKFTGWKELDRLIAGTWYLPRIVTRSRPDVLWAMNLGPYVRCSAPVVLSVNNAFLVYPRSVSGYHPANWLHIAALRWFFRRSLAVADGVLTQTAPMAERVRDLSKRPLDISVAPKAVEDESSEPALRLPERIASTLSHPTMSNVFTFLYAASWVPHKNHGVVLRALAELDRRRVPARLIVTAELDEVLRSGLPGVERLVDTGRVLPLGWIPRQDLKSLYAVADGCLMPSLLESLSSSHIEAMAWGVPQIVADLPYSHDLCGPAAIYADPFNPAEWAAAIESLVSNEPLRNSLVAEGKGRMQERFPKTWTEAAGRVHQTLLAVADERSCPTKEEIPNAPEDIINVEIGR